MTSRRDHSQTLRDLVTMWTTQVLGTEALLAPGQKVELVALLLL